MLVSARIHPNSKHREEIIKNDEYFDVYVKDLAIEGRANTRSIELLSKYFGVPKANVSLVRGKTSKYKVFKIREIN